MKNIKINKKENRSVIKTKVKLKEGIIFLLKEKPVSEITVKELCDMVDINRGTFYYHYTDIYDMIGEVEENFFNEFNQIIKDMNSEEKVDPSYIIEKVFEFFDKNAELSEVLIGPNGDISFLNHLKELVNDMCSEAWSAAGSHLDESEFELFNSFIINGYIGLLETWLQTGRKQSPKYMANFVAKIIIPASINTLSLDEDSKFLDKTLLNKG